MVRPRPEARGARRQIGRRRRRRLPDVLRRGSLASPCGHGQGRPRGGPVPFRLRRHEGSRRVSLPVAILAGGLATRLRPITSTIPKALVEIDGTPFAALQADLLADQQISRVIWLVGYRGEQIEAALGDGSRWAMQFEYLYDGPELLGTGGAIKRALPRLGDAFFVMYGDSYLDCDFAPVEAAFRESRRAALMTVFRNDGQFDASNIEFADGRIVRYDKRTL